MDSFDNQVLIVLCVNAMLFLGQFAVLAMDPQAPSFFNCKGSMLGNVEAQSCSGTSYSINDTNPTLALPSGETSVDPDTGNPFTDTFTGLKNWLLESTPLGFFVNLILAPYNFLKALGLPNAFVFAAGSIWYIYSLVVVVAWLFGRGN